MALITEKTHKRVEHPSEAGTWAVLALPLTAGDLRSVTANDRVGVTIELVAAALVEWSYDQPINVENVSRLDIVTLRWLEAEIDASAGPETNGKTPRRRSRARS